MERMSKVAATLSLAAGLVAAGALPATAGANLVINGNFTPTAMTHTYYTLIGDVPNWTGGNPYSGEVGAAVFGVASNSFWDNSYVPGGQGTSGYVAFIQGSVSYIQQTINGLTIGDTYQLTYYASQRAGGYTSSQGVISRLGGDIIPAGTTGVYVGPQSSYGSTANPFYEITGTVVATAASELLLFQNFALFADDSELIANVSLVDLTNPGTTAAPEPASLAVLGASMVALGVVRRKRGAAG